MEYLQALGVFITGSVNMFLSVLNTYDSLNILYLGFPSNYATLVFAIAGFYKSTSHLYC